MSRLVWGQLQDRHFETGVDKGVLYPMGKPGVVWNGLISADSNSANSTVEPYYIDGRKYLDRIEVGEYSATIEAYTYPDELDEINGVTGNGHGLYFTAQPPQMFGLSYRTLIGDSWGQEVGYKLHMVYNAVSVPSSRTDASMAESVDAATFGWDITTTPVVTLGRRPTAHLIVDSTKTEPYVMLMLEDILYGDDENAPRMPTQTELLELFDTEPIFIVIDYGDGTWSATGPDSMISMIDATTFEITSNSIIRLDNDSYSIASF